MRVLLMDNPESYRPTRPRVPRELRADGGLLLKTRADIDTSSWYAMIAENRDHLGRFLPWTKGYPEEQSIIHHLEACDMIKRGRLATYGIYKEDGLVGAVSLYKITETSAQLGYWLTRDAEGQGIMTAAAARLLRMGFEDLGLQSVGAEVLPDNHRSRAVIERLGGHLYDVNEDGELVYIIPAPDNSFVFE